MDKAPGSVPVSMISDYMTYIIVAITTIWGGLVSYFNNAKKFSWRRLFTHLSSSSFAGMVTGFLCQAAGVDGPLMFALCGVSAHMGTPALIQLLMRSKYVKKFVGEE